MHINWVFMVILSDALVGADAALFTGLDRTLT